MVPRVRRHGHRRLAHPRFFRCLTGANDTPELCDAMLSEVALPYNPLSRTLVSLDADSTLSGPPRGSSDTRSSSAMAVTSAWHSSAARSATRSGGHARGRGTAGRAAALSLGGSDVCTVQRGATSALASMHVMFVAPSHHRPWVTQDPPIRNLARDVSPALEQSTQLTTCNDNSHTSSVAHLRAEPRAGALGWRWSRPQ